MAAQGLLFCGCSNGLSLSALSNDPLHHPLYPTLRGGSSSSTIRLQKPRMRVCIGKRAIFTLDDSAIRVGLIWAVVGMVKPGNAGNSGKWQNKLNGSLERLLNKSKGVIDPDKNRIICYTALKEWKKVYRKNIREWLFILEDVFNGRNVSSAEEDEVLPLALGSFSNLANRAIIREAERLANDLPQVGNLSKTNSNISRVSSQFDADRSEGNETYLRSMVCSASAIVQNTSPFIRYLAGSFVLFYGLCFVWGCCIVFSSRMQTSNEKEVSEKDLRLTRIRHMKSELSGEVELSEAAAQKQARNSSRIVLGAKLVMEDDEAFRKSILEIRHMAMQARLAEQQDKEVPYADSLPTRSSDAVIEGASSEESNRTEILNSNVNNTILNLSSSQLTSLAKQLDDVRKLSLNATNHLKDAEESSTGFESDEKNAFSRSSGDNFNQGSMSDMQEPNKSLSRLLDEDVQKQSLRESSRDKNGRSASPTCSARLRVKPRVIFSVEEAKARLAAKKGKTNDENLLQKSTARPSHIKAKHVQKLKSEHDDADDFLPQKQISGQEGDPRTFVESPRNGAVLGANFVNQQLDEGKIGESNLPFKKQPVISSSGSGSSTIQDQQQKAKYQQVKDHLQNVKLGSPGRAFKSNQKATEVEEAFRKQETGKAPGASEKLHKEEQFTWMKDDVLREIVFKVRANEHAGKDPFHGLGSEEQFLFFKGLEKKFEQEEERVKHRIKERVDNLDNGANDPSEVYEVKHKGPKKAPKTDDSEKFQSDLIRQKTDSKPPPFSHTSSSMPAASSSTETSKELFENSYNEKLLSKDKVARHNFTKSSSPVITRSGGAATSASKSSSPIITRSGGAANFSENSSKNPWQHTKKWGKELQMKYDTETDRETRALMKSIGKDLDRWITEEEIDEAYDLLSKGAAGEEEYVRRNYEKTKAKIKQQKELFGSEALISKYREYQPEKEDELWWFDLPYVLCLGLQMTESNEVRGGLYSLDMSVDLEGSDKEKTNFQTIAFQDRQEALNFCYFLKSQHEKVSFNRVEIVPYSPKELYNEAKAEAFHVTVIRKGQLQLVPGKSLEEVEQRIIEIGTASYWNKRYCGHAIDMHAVLKEGFGHGRSSS
ncbi:hypothetical protein O6H91_Y172000 [Diphasiastrum complanatum]|nr:hypothetical protein O6H91_Y172000 [Diphasiastrum complanatum]